MKDTSCTKSTSLKTRNSPKSQVKKYHSNPIKLCKAKNQNGTPCKHKPTIKGKCLTHYLTTDYRKIYPEIKFQNSRTIDEKMRDKYGINITN